MNRVQMAAGRRVEIFDAIQFVKLRRSIIVLAIAVFAVVGSKTSEAQTAFDLAEQRVADCAARADLHPPYVLGQNTVLDVCRGELEAYQQACKTRRPRDMYECPLEAARFAQSMQRDDPIDRQFTDCLTEKRRAGRSPMALLTLCRAERYAFETSCRQRKSSDLCEKDADTLARAACVISGGICEVYDEHK
jgi:hypothetical protein